MSFDLSLSYENHEELGCIWHYGTEHATLILNYKPTERQLRKLRKIAYKTLRPIHDAAVAMNKEWNDV